MPFRTIQFNSYSVNTLKALDQHIVHDDVIRWKHFPRYWPFERGIHRSPLNSPHKGQWRGALMFSLICAWTNGWVNTREAGDLRRNRAHYDVIVMSPNWFEDDRQAVDFIPVSSDLQMSWEHFIKMAAARLLIQPDVFKAHSRYHTHHSSHKAKHRSDYGNQY